MKSRRLFLTAEFFARAYSTIDAIALVEDAWAFNEIDRILQKFGYRARGDVAAPRATEYQQIRNAVVGPCPTASLAARNPTISVSRISPSPQQPAACKKLSLTLFCSFVIWRTWHHVVGKKGTDEMLTTRGCIADWRAVGFL
ncbi:hypothetical protein [Rhodanobacter sp. MP1X3]|uniref:hypothetical protein n=1 Tax=Rhodanobacter sp. MP1X3 TaxID=2723086 RepID=UPI001621C1EE|nr:hypothetical protein [Rhodanobacter sp. MP1X3]MBB6241961.1 hypothetical protein [Rhodanobacter sp. MP1X3]